jgi:hypothetical protein
MKPVACHWITKGKLKLAINNRVMYVDYGTGGDCDDQALLIWANGQIGITLP